MTEDDSLLTEELSLAIRKLVIAGYSYVDIRTELGIRENTWDSWYWKDYKGLRVKLNAWKKERMLKTAEEFSKDLMSYSRINEDGKLDKELAKIQQKEAEFLRETLGKDEGYTKRNEQTGKDGEALQLGVIMLPTKDDNTLATTTETSTSIEE